MSVPLILTAHSAWLKTPVVSETWIDQIQNARFAANNSLLVESGSGETDAKILALAGRAPVLNFDTSLIGFLTTCGLDGVHIYPGASAAGFKMFCKAKAQGALNEADATAAHVVLAVSDGLLLPVSFGGSHNQAAKLSLALHAILGSDALYSGATPVVISKDTAITAGNGLTTIIYLPCVVKYTISGGASRLVQGVLSMSGDFNHSLIKEATDSEVDPTHVSISMRAPVLKFSTRDLELLADVGEGGVNCSSFAQFYQKASPNGTRVAKTTAEHFSVTATSGILLRDAGSTPHAAAGAADFVFHTAKPAGASLTFSATATIPTT